MKVAQSCPTLCNPTDYIVHGVLQTRILNGQPFPSPGDLPNPGIEPRSIHPHCRQILYQLRHKGSPSINRSLFYLNPDILHFNHTEQPEVSEWARPFFIIRHLLMLLPLNGLKSTPILYLNLSISKLGIIYLGPCFIPQARVI